MPLTRYVVVVFLCLLFSFRMEAQFFDYGSDPARFKWSIVKLDHYNLLYPQGLDSMAYRYALYLENVYPHLEKTIGEPFRRKFPVVLHPANMYSNGVVSWAPRRMELITTPSAKQDAQRWDKHLVLHESRHVFQTSKVMRGWFKPLYYLVGEQSVGLASLFLPSWFLEGDAVSTETAMSNAGRGRLPEFNMVYRTQILSGEKFYAFDKWNLDSYKDYTGDYYALGYNITSYGRYQYGADLWDKTTTRYVKRYPFFSSAIKDNTGLSLLGLYSETFSFLKSEWEKQDTAYMVPDYISSPVKQYTSYRYPQALNDSTIIAVKSGLADINSLVYIVNGKEKHLSYIGTANSRILLKNNHVYWTELIPGYRWTHETYSVLKCLDLETRKTKIITPKQRYLSPSIDSSGKTVAMSRTTLTGENHLVLVDLETGIENRYYRVPDNAFIKDIAFGDNDKIAAVTVHDTGIKILQLNIFTSEWSELLGTTSANITSPVWKDGELYFESGLNGINNIYSLDTSTLRANRITSARFGAFDPGFSEEKNQLLISDYQAKGYRIASLSMDSLDKEDADFTQPHRYVLAENLAQQEQFNLDSAELKPVEFIPKPYRKLSHSMKIHSWAPLYYNVTELMSTLGDDISSMAKPGVNIMSQNTLNTAILQAGWYYDDGYHHGALSFAYKGWLPVFNLTLDYGDKAFDMRWEKNEEDKNVLRYYKTGRNLLEAEAWAYIPFNLTKGHYIRGIQPSLFYYFTNNQYQQFDSKKMRNFQYLLPEIRFYNYRRMAHKDILPRWGYQLRLQYLSPLFNKENYGSLYAGQLTTYWPGVVKNHSLMIRGAYQYQHLDDKALYIPERILTKTRGYNYLYQTHQQAGFKIDYAFPILMPDLSIGPLVYIRRLRANLFYDYTRNQAGKNATWTTQSSYGADILFDWNMLRIRFPVVTGVRLIKPIDYGKFQAEMLFSVSF